MGALINERDVKLLVDKYDVEKTGKIAFEEYMLMMSEVVDKPDTTDLIT
jgi:hypothetical protein